MDRKKKIYPSASEDAQASELYIPTPQTLSPSYRLAYRDVDFLLRDELRPARLQLELLKPELIMKEHNIENTIIVFGSARTAANARYYEEARRLSFLISQAGKESDDLNFVIVTGGGPGIMEAANRGAFDAGAESIGLNIVLPFEQKPNDFITPELSFQFHYFAVRKMHFLIRARALVVFPGGFGTMDELFETLTLIQTRKIKPIPVLIFGREFWDRVVRFDAMVEEGVISPEDLDLFKYVETAEEACEVILRDYKERR